MFLRKFVLFGRPELWRKGRMRSWTAPPRRAGAPDLPLAAAHPPDPDCGEAGMALEAVQAQAGHASIVCQDLPGVQNPLLRGMYDHAAPCASRAEAEVGAFSRTS
jgi:hypothetical protein